MKVFLIIPRQGLPISTSSNQNQGLLADWLSTDLKFSPCSACTAGGTALKGKTGGLMEDSLIGFPAKEQLRWEAACLRRLANKLFALWEHTRGRPSPRLHVPDTVGDVRGPPAAMFALCLHQAHRIRHGRGRNLYKKQKMKKKGGGRRGKNAER